MKKLLGLLLFIGCWGCKEKYIAPLNNPLTTYLVVEGFINSGTGATTIKLSRTTKLSDTITILKEIKATVRVEAKNSTSSFLFTESSAGTYTYPQLTLNPSDEYRVRIQTSNGKQYLSDYSSVRTTVDIDSISWKQENNGVQIYANAHDAANKTKYYRYEYDETWEFHSAFPTLLKTYLSASGEAHHIGYADSVRGSFDSSIYKCWKSFSSTNILVTTTERLTQDVVSSFPLTFIEPDSWKLSVLYSINLKQYAMSSDAYHFYEQLRRNTQQLGSIFDAQPSDNTGNIHPAAAGSTEVVIGFIEVSQEKQKRIFISNAQVPAWRYDAGCLESDRSIPNPDSVKELIGLSNRATHADPLSTDLKRVFYAPIACVDCTKKGVNVKPSFWP